MQKLLYTTLFLWLASGIYATNLELDIQKALDLAEDQQIQSQRIAKIYLALCNNIREPLFYQNRDEAIERFDEQLRQLSLFTPNEDIKKNIKNVRAIWAEYKKIAGWSIKNDAASKLIKQSRLILEATKELYLAYSKYNKSITNSSDNSDLITIKQYLKQNRKQLILTERIMLYYLSKKQGIDPNITGRNLEDAQKTFSRILSILEKSRITSKSIQSKLVLIRKHWAVIYPRLVFVDKEQSYVNDLLNRANLISSIIKDISKKYVELSVKLNISYSINEASMQTFYVQKIAKSYIASINNNVAYKHKKEINEYADNFEYRMNSMLLTAQTEDIKNAVTVVKTMWKNYKNLATSFESIDAIQATKLIEQSYVVMAACDRVSEEVEKHALEIPAYKALSRINDLKVDPSLDLTRQFYTSSALRINSQRFALYFILSAFDIDSDLSKKRLMSTIQEFKKQLEELKSSKINSSAITLLLESCYKEWNWIKEASLTTHKEDIDLVLEHTNLLSKKLVKLTNLYQHKMNDFFAEDL